MRNGMIVGLAVAAVVITLSGLTGCGSHGQVKNPFVKDQPFVATVVPADFAIVVDENHDTFYARQHIRQEIILGDSLSKTTYTTLRDYNNGVSNRFSQETPLSPEQLQAMWNAISKYRLMDGAHLWMNWLSDADLYKHNQYSIQIRANGQTRSYSDTNSFPAFLRPLMLQIEAVRLPITQNANVQVVTPETQPAATEATTLPVDATGPAVDLPAPKESGPAPSAPTTTAPSTEPATSQPATIPGM